MVYVAVYLVAVVLALCIVEVDQRVNVGMSYVVIVGFETDNNVCNSTRAIAGLQAAFFVIYLYKYLGTIKHHRLAWTAGTIN